MERAAELRRLANEGDGIGLARLLTDEARRVGKHFVDPELLAEVALIRDEVAGRSVRLDAFLEGYLDKHEGRYWNRTYLSFPLLEALTSGPEKVVAQSGLVALLAADIVRFELAAHHARGEMSVLGRPDRVTFRKRVRHCLKLLKGLPPQPKHVLDTPAGEWLHLTLLPVSTVHDEYFFMRVLQIHEITFGRIAHLVAEAVALLRGGDAQQAARQIGVATALVGKDASLFRMVATMRPEAFHTFREWTDGASAIQSEQYKRFEVLCGPPRPDRLQSPAFERVPAVTAFMAQGVDSLTDAYLDDPGRAAPLDDALRQLEKAHQRWKANHVSLAIRVLGHVRGSGGTSGVPYLKGTMGNRLFWQLPLFVGEVDEGADAHGVTVELEPGAQLVE